MTQSRRLRLLALLAATELVVGGVTALRWADEVAPPTTSADRARATVDTDDPQVRRTRAIERLLADRAQAIRRRDRAAFLAGIDTGPAATAFRKRQAAVFAALEDVPLASWSYDVDPVRERPADARVDRLRGPGWYAPDVVLRYALKGFDVRPTVAEQFLTFVQRDGRWLLAADDDFKEVGQASTPGIWDGGDVVVVKGERSLVLGHPRSKGLLRRVADEVDAAVPRVTRVYGRAWSQKVVVLVPDTSAELAELLDTRSDFSQIAAVATAELTGGDGFNPVGDRVIVNPPNFAKLGRLGQQVVLTHEVTHVATRQASGPLVPTWVVEGFADYVGYQDTRVPLAVAAKELREAIRAGKGPKALPEERDFEATNPDLAQVYEQAWLAVTRLVEVHGLPRFLAFYRDVGSTLEGDREAVTEAAFRKAFGRDQAAFTADWLQRLRTTLR